MSKKINIHQDCLISDDKGSLSLRPKAVEAMNTLNKNNVEVSVLLTSLTSDEVKKLLEDNKLGFVSVLEKDSPLPDADVTVFPSKKGVTYHGDWQYTIESIADSLYLKGSEPKSEQTKMNEAFDDYKRMAQKVNMRNQSDGRC